MRRFVEVNDLFFPSKGPVLTLFNISILELYGVLVEERASGLNLFTIRIRDLPAN
jgi:hypothetical protein